MESGTSRFSFWASVCTAGLDVVVADAVINSGALSLPHAPRMPRRQIIDPILPRLLVRIMKTPVRLSRSTAIRAPDESYAEATARHCRSCASSVAGVGFHGEPLKLLDQGLLIAERGRPLGAWSWRRKLSVFRLDPKCWGARTGPNSRALGRCRDIESSGSTVACRNYRPQCPTDLAHDARECVVTRRVA